MERIMQNRKWILTSLVMTFFGIPILAQFLAVVIAMLGVGLAGIIEVCNILITPTIYLLLKIYSSTTCGKGITYFADCIFSHIESPLYHSTSAFFIQALYKNSIFHLS
jgi:hypothetical protein